WPFVAVAAAIALVIGYVRQGRQPLKPPRAPTTPSAEAAPPTCIEAPANKRIMTLTGTVRREGKSRFVLDLDLPVCGATPIEHVVLYPNDLSFFVDHTT